MFGIFDTHTFDEQADKDSRLLLHRRPRRTIGNAFEYELSISEALRKIHQREQRQQELSDAFAWEDDCRFIHGEVFPQ